MRVIMFILVIFIFLFNLLQLVLYKDMIMNKIFSLIKLKKYYVKVKGYKK